MKNTNIALSIVLSSLLISFAIYNQYGLDVLQKIFSIIGSLSLVIAFSTYLYKKQQDKVLATIEQVGFFREKIVFQSDTVSKLIRQKIPQYMFSHIELKKDSSIEDLRKNFPFNFNDQLSVFFNDTTLSIDPILDEYIILLNMLEEFSLRVNHLKTQQHPALESVYYTFVGFVQRNAVALFFVRDIMSNSTNYSAILTLYGSWETKFKKPNFINNLEKHGFITEEKKKEILKKQRENVRGRVAKSNIGI